MQRESNIQDFEILNKLGEGSFSQVYKVKRKSDGKLYAMKKVKMSLLSAKERENALNEIRILASLSSPQIVQYKDSFVDTDSNILCVIMEYAAGGDLNKLLEQGKLKGGVDEQEIWNVLVQMTMGLKNLHDLKILHRDLKCANVFVQQSPNGNIYKLGDLNISKVTKGAAAKTQAGTPYYAAPEVWKGELYSSPCDIWSMGCIIYELAALKPPFRANDLSSLNQKIQKGIYDPLPSKYSKDLPQIISTMLRINPSSRPTCTQILNNPTIMKNSGALFINAENSNNGRENLLQTIKLPRNLHLLKGNLPKAKYEDQVQSCRASSAGPRRINIEQSQEVVEKQKPFVPLQPTSEANQQKNFPVNKPIQPTANKPPMQLNQKPPSNLVKQDYNNMQQKISEQKIVQQQQQSRNSNPRLQSPSSRGNYQQQPYQKPAAGIPSGMGRRQNSAHQVGRR